MGVAGPRAGLPVKGRTKKLGGSERPPHSEGKCRAIEIPSSSPTPTHARHARQLESENKEAGPEARSK